jgi:phage FluMu gp28-like protein
MAKQLSQSLKNKPTKFSKNQNDNFRQAFNYILNKKLYLYQREWLLDGSRFKIATKARQIGLSEMFGLEGVLLVLQGFSVYYVSRSEKQAIYLLDKFYKWCDYFIACGVPIAFESRSRTECKVNGVYVTSLTSNATTGEGFTGHIFLDEFSLLPNDEDIYRSIYPSITRGYKLRIISRPFGQSNLFHELFHNVERYPDFKRYSFDIYRAIKDGLRIDIEQLRRNFTEDSFSENYECKFLDESTSYFPYNLLRNCIGENTENIADCKNYIGIDVARKQHLTVFYVISKLGDYVYTRNIEVMRNATFDSQKQRIRDLIFAYNIEGGGIDATGLGNQMAEELHEEFPFLQAIWFTNEIKERMVNNLKMRFEASTIQIPNDIDLIDDIHKIRRTVSSSNNLIFDAVADSKSHADRFWALALANYSALEDKRPNIIIL